MEKSGDNGIEGNGENIQGDRSGEDVSGYGSETAELSRAIERQARLNEETQLSPEEQAAQRAGELIDSMPSEDLSDMIGEIDQEHADFDLAFPKKSEKEKSFDNTFTFNDGVKVHAPFKPNQQQEDALNELSDFIKSDEHIITLVGDAGTGKTSVMEMLAEKMKGTNPSSSQLLLTMLQKFSDQKQEKHTHSIRHSD